MKQKAAFLLAILFAGYLGIFQGRIAVFREGQTLPERVFPYEAQALPPDARAALEKGIPFEDTKKLSQILEAYLP